MYKDHEGPIKLASAVVAVALGMFSVSAYVHKTIREIVSDESFLRTFSARVRPTCIFDTHGAVESDLGASEYIDEKEISVSPIPRIYGYEIRLKGKQHMAYSPLVMGLDSDLFSLSAVRGKGHDWVLVVCPNSTLGGSVLVR
jgi:hypothetical protein